MTQDLYNTKKYLELEWQQEHLKDGKHNIRMTEINRKIQDVIKEIIDEEFKADTLQTKVNDAKPEVSIAT
jgi:Fe2+ or Zn2+ uptake regulation protein